MQGNGGVERRRLPAWLQGRQALRPASGSYPPRGALGRYGLGYKLLMQDQLGMGKTVEAGLIAAEMAFRDAVPFGLWTIDGQHQLSGLHRWEGTVGPGTAPVLAEAPLRPEPFAPRKFRARLVPRPESYQELRWRAEKREAEGRDQDRVVTAGERCLGRPFLAPGYWVVLAPGEERIVLAPPRLFLRLVARFPRFSVPTRRKAGWADGDE